MTVAALQDMIRRPACLAALAAALASIALAAAAALAVWRPAQLHEVAAFSQAARLGGTARALRARARMAEEYKTRAAEVEALEAKLKSDRDAPELVRDLEALAAKSGAELLQVSSRKAPRSDAAIETTVFEFALKGSYESLKTFLVALGKLPEFIVVERAVFERIDTGVRVRVIVMRRAAVGA